MQLTLAVAVVAAILLVAYFATKQSALPERAVAIGAAVAVLGALAYKNTTARGGQPGGPSSPKKRSKEEKLKEIADLQKKIDRLRRELSSLSSSSLSSESSTWDFYEHIDKNRFTQAMKYINSTDSGTLNINAIGDEDDYLQIIIEWYKKDGKTRVKVSEIDGKGKAVSTDTDDGKILYEHTRGHTYINTFIFDHPITGKRIEIAPYYINIHDDVENIIAQMLSMK